MLDILRQKPPLHIIVIDRATKIEQEGGYFYIRITGQHRRQSDFCSPYENHMHLLKSTYGLMFYMFVDAFMIDVEDEFFKDF